MFVDWGVVAGMVSKQAVTECGGKLTKIKGHGIWVENNIVFQSGLGGRGVRGGGNWSDFLIP